MKLLYIHALSDLDLEAKGFLPVFERRLKVGGLFDQVHVLSAPGPATPLRDGVDRGTGVFYYAPSGGMNWTLPRLLFHLVAKGRHLVSHHGLQAIWACDPALPLVTGAFVGLITRTPFIVSYQSDPDLARRADGRLPLMGSPLFDRLATDWALRRANCGLAFNDRQRLHLESRCPVKPFRNTPELSSLLTLKPPFDGALAYLGLLTDTKNPLCAIEAHRIYAAKGGRRPLHIMGDGPLMAVCRKAVAQGQDVRFHGFVAPSELASLLQSCAILLHPSRHEGFSNALMEAQAAGLVPIVSNLDVIKSGMVSDACLTFSPGDPNSMGARVLELDANPELWRRLSLKAKADLARWQAEDPDHHNRSAFEDCLGQAGG